VETLVSKVPAAVEIGGILVAFWWKIRWRKGKQASAKLELRRKKTARSKMGIAEAA